MWSLQMFPLDSLVELPLTSPFHVPANLFPPDQLWLCDRDRSLTWPLLLCCLYIPGSRVLASFLVLQFGSQQPWGLTETTLAPVVSFQRDVQKSIQKCCPVWWRWPQTNMILGLIWAFQITWALPIRPIRAIGAVLPIPDMGEKKIHLWSFFPSNILPFSSSSAHTGCAVSLFLSFVWQWYCMHINEKFA